MHDQRSDTNFSSDEELLREIEISSNPYPISSSDTCSLRRRSENRPWPPPKEGGSIRGNMKILFYESSDLNKGLKIETP